MSAIGGNKISTVGFNSRSAATLAAAATFQGVSEDVSEWGRVGISFVNVDATNGDFVTLLDVDMQRQAGLVIETIDFGSHGLHCDDAHHFGPTTANSTLFQTDVNLLGPDGATSYPSGAGDIVLMVIGAGSGNAQCDITVTMGYEAVA